MRNLILQATFAAVATLAANRADASANFTENAGNAYYDSGWSFGSSQPNNFGWFTSTSVTAPGYAGRFLGDSTGLASPGNYPNINTAGRAWGMYGGSGGSGSGQSDAYGFLKDGAGNDEALFVGQTLALDLAVNWRNGYKGFAARDSGGTELFTLNIGGDDYSVLNATTGNGSIGNAYSDNTVFHIAVTQTSLSVGTWAITRSGGVADFDTGTFSGVVANFKLYVGQTASGSPNDFFVNNLSVSAVPEPSTLAILGLGLAILARQRNASHR